MRKNHKIKAALFAGLAGTMMLGSCLTAYAAGVTKANGKLYYYQADGSLANGLIHDTASDKYYYALSDGSLVTGWLHLDQDYYFWFQRRRDDQKVSGAKRRGIWCRQAGRCHYCGQPMLSDQEFRLVELVLGRGHTVSNLAYIHRSCAYDVVIDEGKEGDSSNLDVLTLLDGVTEPVRGLEVPYWDLREVFRLCVSRL